MRVSLRVLLCVIGLLGVLTASLAHSETCVDAGLVKLKRAMVERSSANYPGMQLQPGTQYEGLRENQIKAHNQTAFINNVFTEMSGVLRDFVEKNKGEEAIAQARLGSANRREVTVVLRRDDEAGSLPSPNIKCTEGECADLAVITKQMFMSRRSAEFVVDALSQSKLTTHPKAQPTGFCVTGPGCQKEEDFTVSTNAKGMRLNVPYTVSESTKLPLWLGTINGLSIVEVTPFEICNEKAYLLSEIQAKGGQGLGAKNSFDNSTLFAVVSEHKGKTLMFGHYQATELKMRNPVPLVFLQHFDSVQKSMANLYNEWAEESGSNERVTPAGLLGSN